MQDGHFTAGRRPRVEPSWGDFLGAPPVSRRRVITLILVLALLAFEIFNFDTTRYALADLLGQANFAGVRWAVILALAFCAIDFAGLVYLFAPAEEGEPREVWYLMGAWLLGATMNAMMTWWAVNLTLLAHPLGNEVLSRGQLLEFVPPFVAVLVWLTRILFIGAFSVAGEHLGPEDAGRSTLWEAASAPAREATGERERRFRRDDPHVGRDREAPVPSSAGPVVRPQPVSVRARGRS